MPRQRQPEVVTFIQSHPKERLMSATASSRTRRIFHRIAATWSDLDYANRRKFELQTGITGITRGDKTRTPSRDSAHL